MRRFNETCDDENLVSGDGCSVECFVECGYSCDLQHNDHDTCQTTCGDGVRAGSETCDDKNGNNNDGCSESCTIEVGWITKDGFDSCSTSVMSECTDNSAPNTAYTECSSCRNGFTLVAGTCKQDCSTGYTGTAGSCEKCASGTYKDATGSAPCNTCDAATPISPLGSVNAAACESCEANQVPKGDKTGCECAPLYTDVQGICEKDCSTGHTGPAGNCAKCAGGTYKAVTGSALCETCDAANPISPLGSVNEAACKSCVANQVPKGDNTGCDCASFHTNVAGICQEDCVRGHTGTAGSCEKCAGGTYKAVPGSALCKTCNAATPISPVGSVNADVCTQCGTNSVAKTDSTLCICKMGSEKINGASSCSLCSIRHYKNVEGDGACTLCPPNSMTTGVGKTQWTDCKCDATNGWQATPGLSTVQCEQKEKIVQKSFELEIAYSIFLANTNNVRSKFQNNLAEIYETAVDKITLTYHAVATPKPGRRLLQSIASAELGGTAVAARIETYESRPTVANDRLLQELQGRGYTNVIIRADNYTVEKDGLISDFMWIILACIVLCVSVVLIGVMLYKCCQPTRYQEMHELVAHAAANPTTRNTEVEFIPKTAYSAYNYASSPYDPY